MKLAAVLLDFDGPVTSLFATSPAPLITKMMHELLRSRGLDTSPFENLGPIRTLREASLRNLDLPLQLELEDMLTRFELDAARTSPPAPGSDALLSFLRPLPLAVVTNNTPGVVSVHLDARALPVLPAFGRLPLETEHLKPSPYRLHEAAAFLDADPARTLMIGDKPSDVLAAHAAGMLSAGFAKSPRHRLLLEGSSPSFLVDDLSELLGLLAW